MEQYIDKSAIVAEIEKRKSQFMSQADSFYKLEMEEEMNRYAILASNMQSLLSFINTLEVKEMNSNDAFIEKACEWLNNFYNEDTHSYLIDEDIRKFRNYMKGEIINRADAIEEME